MQKICIITVVDSVATTSMPVNEFVLYRHRKNYPFRQELISCTEGNTNNVLIPEDITTHFVGNDKAKMKEALKKIILNCDDRGEKTIYHLHAQKSAMLFYIASSGLGIRNKTLFTIHSTYSGRDLKYKLSSCFCSLMAKYANCVSNASYNEYSSLVKWLKGNRMLAIQNGVDYERIIEAIKNLPKHTEVADKYMMVCVGRMIPIKNQQFLVKLLKYLPETELVLIGKEDNEIATLAKEEGVEKRVIMTGLIPRDEVFQRINECGIYVSASLVEGMPVSVLEAMCVGLIPVLSNISPHEEVAKECLLFHALPLKTELWVQTIKSYQALSDDELSRLSTSLKQIVMKNFSLDKMHNKYNDIYALLAK